MDTNVAWFSGKWHFLKFGANGPCDPKFGPGVQITSNMNAGVQVSP